jgi:hypothetical protein
VIGAITLRLSWDIHAESDLLKIKHTHLAGGAGRIGVKDSPQN